MPKIKIKTHRGAAKRFRKTATGKFKCGHANRSHILTKKSTKTKRQLRGSAAVHSTNMDSVKAMILRGIGAV